VNDQRLHQRAKEIVADALELAPDMRTAHVANNCAADAALLAEVQSLLNHADEDESELSDGVIGRGRNELEALLASAPMSAAAGRSPSVHPPRFSAETPVRVGKYRINRLIGEGGMGRVFEAMQENPRRRVALKLIRSLQGGPALLRRFEYEAQTLGRLEHPGIARIYEAGSAEVVLTEAPFVVSGEPQAFIAMEFVDGIPLDVYARQVMPTVDQKLELLARLCTAVNYAHHHGVIHRDLKPGNILVTADGGLKVLDFGIARVVGEDGSAAHTLTGPDHLIGTPAYMSPEQFESSRSAGVASDVYALGVIAYELLAGRRPHDRGNLSLSEFGRVVCEVRPAALGTVDRALAGDIETIVAKAMAHEPEQRYDSAAAMAADIERALRHEPVLARPQTALYLLKKFARRRRGIVAMALVALLALVAGLIASTVLLFRSDRQARIAEAVNEFLNKDLLKAPTPRGLGIDVKMRDVLDAAASRIEGRFPGEPAVEAAVRTAIGESYQNLGVYDLAEQHLQKAVALRTAALGPRDAGTLAVKNSLASLYFLQGRFAELERLTNEVLAIAIPMLGKDHLLTLTAQANLGMAKFRSEQYPDAERIFKECVDIARRVTGPSSERTILYLQNLASVYLQSGRKQEATDLYGEIWRLCEKQNGPEHPDTINNAANYATALGELGRSAEAEPVMRQALAASRKVFGPANTDTLYTMNALANVLEKLGQAEEAEALFKETLALRREALGTNHTSTVSSLIGLAKFYYRSGRVEESLPLALEAEQVNGAINSKPNYKSVVIATLLGDIHAARGELAEAESAYANAVQAARQSGDTGERLGRALARQGAFLRKAGRPEAAAIQQEALQILQKELGPDHAEVIELAKQL
jgi:serine/threonine protein kinase